MAFQIGEGGSSGGGIWCIEDSGGYDMQNGRRSYRRHTPEQIQRLEAFYKEWPLPDENQRCQLGMELDLEPRQIKFWFQNKRTQIKARKERAKNNALRVENDRIRGENTAMRKALENVICSSCEGPSSKEEERKENLEKLQEENTELRMEYERICNILAKYMGRPVPETAFHLQDPSLSGQVSGSPAFWVDSLIGNINDDNLGLANQMKANAEIEKSLMAEIAASAMDELIKLLRVDQPLWIKSSTYDQYILDQDNYQKIISQSSRFRYPKSRMESSKDSGVVAMNSRSLVELFLNPDKWDGVFPSIVSEARTIHVLEAGLLENRSGGLQLIYERMHILTTLVQPREFYVLRYCQQIDTGIWVIVDVSCDFLSGSSHDFSTCCWKYPSGCMIHEMPNGHSKVTCVEHVEVDENFQAHPIYEDLVKSALGFGARRWIMTLQRTCERYSFLMEAGRPCHENGGGTKSMIKLSCRMVKSYCSIFSLLGSSNFHQLPELTNNRIRIAVRKNSCPDQPVGIIISAATSFWVPASTQTAFQYLNNHIMRSEWDVLCNGNPMDELMRIPTGSHSANCISILQPVNSGEDIIILQESLVDQLESCIVYAPIDASTIYEVATGRDSQTVPILASGFAVTTDGADPTAIPSSSTGIPRSGGSLVTVAFQILASSSLSVEDLSMDVIIMADDFVARSVHVIKCGLGSFD